jgi:DNA-binding protein HU-beta
LAYFINVNIQQIPLKKDLYLKERRYVKMLKKDLVERIAEATGITKKQSAAALDAMLEAVEDSLKAGEPVLLTGFGKFEVRTRAARKGINPKTMEEIMLPETKVPAFKAGKALKTAVK